MKRRWQLFRVHRTRAAACLLIVALCALLAAASRTARRRHRVRPAAGYIALSGCCANAGLGHALASFNRVVHLSVRYNLHIAYDPAPLRNIKHGVGDRAERRFALGRDQAPLETLLQLGRAHRVERVRVANATTADDEIVQTIERTLHRRQRQPHQQQQQRPMLFEMHRLFNPGGQLASDWRRTLPWWRAKFRPERNATAYTVAVHIRRGDQVPGWRQNKLRYYEAGLRRNLPDAWYAAAVRAVLERRGGAGKGGASKSDRVAVHIYSESSDGRGSYVDMDGAPSDIAELFRRRLRHTIGRYALGVNLHLDGDALDVFTALAAADVLVASRSDFSALASRFSTGTVVSPPRLPSAHDFISTAAADAEALDADGRPTLPMRLRTTERRGLAYRPHPADRGRFQYSRRPLSRAFFYAKGKLHIEENWRAMQREMQRSIEWLDGSDSVALVRDEHI